jgi:hypothetical protein
MVPQPFENARPDKIPLPAPLAEMARELSPAMAKLLAFAVVAIATLPATGPGTL